MTSAATLDSDEDAELVQNSQLLCYGRLWGVVERKTGKLPKNCEAEHRFLVPERDHGQDLSDLIGEMVIAARCSSNLPQVY